MDKIVLSGAAFMAKHGVHEFEKKQPQKFLVDLTVYFDLSAAMKSDNLTDTINYGEVYKTVKNVVENNTFDLIERLAGKVLEELFRKFQEVDIISIKIKKPNAPIDGEFDFVAVEIERNRNEL